MGTFMFVRLVVIDAPSPSFRQNLVVSTAFLLLALLAFVPAALSVTRNVSTLYALFSAYIIFSALVLARPLSLYLRAARIRRLASSLNFTTDGFYVSEPIPAEYGYVTVVRRAEGLHRSFSFQMVRDLSQHRFVPDAHLLVIDRHGNGKIVLPGYRLSGRYSGILVLFFVPYYAVYFERDRLSVQSINDVADAFLQPTDIGFQGYLRYNLSRGVGADVYISWPGSDVVQFLAVSGQVENFAYPYIAEPVVVVTHEDYLRPELLASALGVDSLVQGTGNFRVTLRIRFPMEPDAADTTDVSITARV